MPRDFRLQVFFSFQFPPSPWVYFRAVSIFVIKFAEIFKVHHRCRWHRWQKKKSSIRKVLIIFWGHLWVVELRLRSCWPLCYFQGLGGRWYMKNLKQKISWPCSFNLSALLLLAYANFLPWSAISACFIPTCTVPHACCLLLAWVVCLFSTLLSVFFMPALYFCFVRQWSVM